MKDKLDASPKKTGIDGLDKTLGAGIPEGHVVLLTGEAGTGKTVLSMQWLFSGWEENNFPGIYITVTEPFTKAIKNIKSMEFFDEEPLENGSLRFTDLRSMTSLMDFGSKEELVKDDVEELVKRIEELVDNVGARRIVIDSITAIGYMIDDTELFRYFIFRLGTVLSGKNCTVFLTSEERNGDSPFNVEDFISDGIINLNHQHAEQSTIRKLKVSKMRGVDFRSGSIFFDITSEGVIVYPKISVERHLAETSFENKLKTGIKGLDEMVNGGFPQGHIILVTGNTGTGKSTLGMQFLVEGMNNGETSVFVNLEEPIDQVKKAARAHGWDFDKYKEEGLLHYITPQLIDTYPDKFLHEILNVVDEYDAKRLVLDSVSSLPSSGLSEDQLRQILLQLNSALKSRGVTGLMTHLESGLFSAEPGEILGSTQASDLRLSSLCDGIILLRYLERYNRVEKVINVLKMRGCDHNKQIKELKISDKGIEIGKTLEEEKR